MFFTRISSSESSSFDSSSAEEHTGISVDQYPKTYAPWLDGLRGNVQFEEWHDFEALVTNTSNAIENVDSKDNKCLNDALDRLRTEAKDRLVDEFPHDMIRGWFSLCWAYSIIFSDIKTLLRHFERSRDYEFLKQSFYLENASLLWRHMCLRPKTEYSKRRQRPPLKENIPDFTLVMPKGRAKISGIHVCGFALKAPPSNILASNFTSSTHLVDSMDKSEEPKQKPPHLLDVSAEDLCTRYNQLFASDSNTSPGNMDVNDSNVNRDALDVVAQAVSYCLSVASGCAFSFNDEYGVAFEVVKRPYDGQLHVRVSRAFHREDSIIGMLAISRYSIKRVKEDGGLPEFIADWAERIAKATRDAQDDIEHQETSESFEGDVTSLTRTCNGYSKKECKEGNGRSGEETVSDSQNGGFNSVTNNELQSVKTD